MKANTGIINGGDIMVYRNTGTDLSPVWTPIAHATEHSRETSIELRDRVTKNSGRWKSRKAGMMEDTINVSALRAYDGENYFSLLAIATAGTSVKIKYSGRPAADVTAGEAEVAEQTGDKYTEGFYLIDKITSNDAVNADSTMTASFKSNGEVSVETKA